MIVIKRLTEVCGACPTSWDAVANDGREYYIKYRYGQLKIWEETNGQLGEMIFNKQIGHRSDSVMSVDRMQHHTQGVLSFEL